MSALFWGPFCLGLLVFVWTGWNLYARARVMYAVSRATLRRRVTGAIALRALVTVALPLAAYVGAAWWYRALLDNDPTVRDIARRVAAGMYFLFLSPALLLSLFVRGAAGFLLGVWGIGTAFPGSVDDLDGGGPGAGDGDGGEGGGGGDGGGD